MPWNQNDSNNPWGNRPSGGGSKQTPPDLDEVVKRLQERLSGLFGGGGSGGGNGGGEVPRPLMAGGLMIALLVGLVYFCSYIVAADEEAVVLRFGQFDRVATPGWNWKFPSPMEKVEKVPVTRIQRLEIGFRDYGEGREKRVIPQEAMMLTKDENIVDIRFVVQFKVKDVEAYLFNVSNPVKTVRDVSESSIREVIGRTLIDDVLTDKKAEVEVETQQLIQSILDGYHAGVSVTAIKLSDVRPPQAVDADFKDVQAAREDKERLKNEAQAYANDIIPKSRGEAKKMVLDAEAYAKAVVDRAKGEADRFNSLLTAYRMAPEVTRKRMYFETMQEVMSKVDKVIVDGRVADRVLPYLPLDRAGKVEVK